MMWRRQAKPYPGNFDSHECSVENGLIAILNECDSLAGMAK